MKKTKNRKFPGVFLPGRMMRTMKLMTLLLVLQTFQVTAKGYSQENITLKMKNVTFAEVVKEIERQSKVTFLYNHDYVRELDRLNPDYSNLNLQEVLDHILTGTNLEYKLIDNTVVITAKQGQDQFEQEIQTIKGKVVDVQGHTLPGVTVVIKGTNLGVATDMDGRFSIQVPRGKAVVLVCTFVGMRKKEVNYVEGKELTIVMEEEAAEMDEVIVTGYFQKSKESFTGSEVTINTEELKKVGALNMIQALNAFDPSIRLNESLTQGSNPNVIPDITIRGENGFDLRANADDATTNPNAPLYILDGVEVSAERIYDMDLNRVESTTILKDASATALYGSRGANGVIVITTIRPKAGQIRINLNANYNVSIPDLRDYNLMNAAEKLEYERRAGVYTDPVYSEQVRLEELYNSRLEEVKRGVDTYWLSQPLTTSLNQRYSLNFEGGDQYFRYGVDLRYDTDKGVMKKSGRDRLGINLTFNYNIGSSFFIRNDLSVDNVKAKNSPYNEFSLYANQNPYDRIYDENGEFVEKLSSGDWNPLVSANLPKRNTSTYTSVQDNFNIDWRIIPALRLQGRFSYTRQFDRRDLFKSPESLDYSTETDPKKKGSYYLVNSRSDRFDGNLTLAYNKTIDKHMLNVGVGSNIMQSETEGESFTGVGFINPDMIFIGAANAFQENTSPQGTYDKSRLVGFFTNVNYGYGNRYFLDFSFRSDGSSKFGRNSRFAPFWSFGLGVNLHKYDFIQSLGFVNQLKVRTSYGQIGKANFPAYAARSTYDIVTDEWYKTGISTRLKALGNKNLTWETTNTFDIGAELSLFNDLLYVKGAYYDKRTIDLVNDVTVPTSTGFSSYRDNVGEISNKGYEFDVRVAACQTKDWSVIFNFNLAHNKNRIEKISESLRAYNERVQKMFEENLMYNDPDRALQTQPFLQYVEGGSMNSIFCVRSLGINPADGQEVFVSRNGQLTKVWNASDQVAVGTTEPKAQGTFGFNVAYKQFSLYTSFMYEGGGQRYNQTLVDKVENVNVYTDNVDERVLTNRWTKPGDKAKYKSLVVGRDGVEDTKPTSRFVQDYNMLSWNSFELGYDLPSGITSKLNLGMLRFSFSMNDILHLSTVKQERGTSYPFARTVTFSIKASL